MGMFILVAVLGNTPAHDQELYSIRFKHEGSQYLPDHLRFQIEAVVDEFVRLGVERSKLERILVRVPLLVSFKERVIACHGTITNRCYGLHYVHDDGSHVIEVWKSSTCLGKTSFAHELIHYFARELYDYGSELHTDPEYFELAGQLSSARREASNNGKNSAEYRAEQAAIKKHCQRGYDYDVR